MNLFLFRHGIAIDREDPECPKDSLRFLTEKGRKRTTAAAKGLHRLQVEPTHFLASPLLRAKETASLVMEVLQKDPARLEITEALEPWAEPSDLMKVLYHFDQDVMCFGHAPNLDEVLAHTLGLPSPRTHLKKAGCACVEIYPDGSQLRWILEPRALRELGLNSA